jgi:hypothetical protein
MLAGPGQSLCIACNLLPWYAPHRSPCQQKKSVQLNCQVGATKAWEGGCCRFGVMYCAEQLLDPGECVSATEQFTFTCVLYTQSHLSDPVIC